MENIDIKFIKEKAYKLIKALNQGGFGKTVLLEDRTIDEVFVCKKYAPINGTDKMDYYGNFVKEIKLLHKVNFRNIVRVFNYYLYPEEYTGYILMEYIDGLHIDNYINENPHKINDIFAQVIQGFRHLEELNILHRDIRPQNILVTNEGEVKIIDFGFGKQIEFNNEDFEKSISLNWFYPPPHEFKEQTYDFRTELYFIGKMFEDLISLNEIQSFSFPKLLKNMVNGDPEKRIQSFFDVEREMISGELKLPKFSPVEKNIYKIFAESVRSSISTIRPGLEYLSDIPVIIQKLETVYNNSILEEHLQENSLLLNCFLKGSYTYTRRTNIDMDVIGDFLKFFKSQPVEKQKITLNNLWIRFDTIDRQDPQPIEDLPF